MKAQTVIAKSYFDGQQYHRDGPYTIRFDRSGIQHISQGNHPSDDSHSQNTNYHDFIMPGLVEAHAHLFLDGGETDLKARSNYLKAPLEEMLSVAHSNADANRAAGITLIRDAGDKHGVNHRLREESECPVIRSAGLALRRPKRYGSFMALEVGNNDEIVDTIKNIAQTADDLKIIETGIIDFEAGTVKGEPQFDLDALTLVVNTAHELGLKTFAHCSGREGIEVALNAGVDSIEHGFFITPDQVKKMADQGTAWVPTVSPVHFQWQHPEIVGWSRNTLNNLGKILDEHFTSIALAHELGVNLVAGSDAGSHGVPHGRALIDELVFMVKAGLPLESVLTSATSRPRRLWREATADIDISNPVNFIALEGNPFANIDHLYRVTEVYCHVQS